MVRRRLVALAPSLKAITLGLMVGGLLAGKGFAQAASKPIIDGAWRGPGWYWPEGDMLGIPILAGRPDADADGKQRPFPTKADCESYYRNVTCAYYATDPSD